MRIIRLSPAARANYAATHKVIVYPADVVTLGAATGPLALALLTVPAGTRVSNCRFNLVTAFNSSDAAINSLIGSLGDGGAVERLITNTELHEDGTQILYKSEGAVTQPYTYLEEDTIDLVLTVSGGGSPLLTETNVGELEVYLKIETEDDLESPKGGGGLVTT